MKSLNEVTPRIQSVKYNNHTLNKEDFRSVNFKEWFSKSDSLVVWLWEVLGIPETDPQKVHCPKHKAGLIPALIEVDDPEKVYWSEEKSEL